MLFMKHTHPQNHADMGFVWVFPNYVSHHGSCAYFKHNREMVINTFITSNISLSHQRNCCCHVHINEVVAVMLTMLLLNLLSCQTSQFSHVKHVIIVHNWYPLCYE